MARREAAAGTPCPCFPWRYSPLRPRGERHCPRQLQQAFRAAPAVMGGLQLIRAARTTCGPALDAAELLKGKMDFASAAAVSGHLDLLWGSDLPARGCKKCSLNVSTCFS